VAQAVALEIVAHQRHRLAHRGIELPRGLEAIATDHRAIGQLVRPHAGEAAIAPGCAPADPARLQHAHVDALSGQFQRGGEAGEARADHRDVAAFVGHEGRRVDAEGIGRGLPVAVNCAVEMEGMRMGCGSHGEALLALPKQKIKRADA
jgi:hypothetical protein